MQYLNYLKKKEKKENMYWHSYDPINTFNMNLCSTLLFIPKS